MTLHLDDGDVRIYHGDAVEQLASMPDASVQCIVTSPPFWGLRDYGTGSWEGGDADCDHSPGRKNPASGSGLQGGKKTQGHVQEAYGLVCGKCGARRVDQQIGLEETPDEWCTRLVAVFREARRVLRDDGVMWLEVGDSYAGTPHYAGRTREGEGRPTHPHDFGGYGEGARPNRMADGLKAKDLVGAPWLLAFALRADGWYLRSDTIWARPNPMPESVTDRPTKSHSYVFLLTKSARYFYDADAIREAASENTHARYASGKVERGVVTPKGRVGHEGWDGSTNGYVSHRNARSVWQIATEPTPFAHFATFPQALVERCILAGTSEHGACSVCGAPWRRVTEPDLTDVPTRLSTKRAPVDTAATAAYLLERRKAAGLSQRQVDEHLGTSTLYSWYEGRPAGTQAPTPEHWTALKPLLGLDDRFDAQIYGTVEVTITDHGGSVDDPNVRRYAKAWNARSQTVGWEASCPHVDAPVVPCVVLDPFMGSGTTALVARRLGRHAVGVELNPEYLAIAATRLQQLSLLGGHA